MLNQNFKNTHLFAAAYKVSAALEGGKVNVRDVGNDQFCEQHAVLKRFTWNATVDLFTAAAKMRSVYYDTSFGIGLH